MVRAARGFTQCTHLSHSQQAWQAEIEQTRLGLRLNFAILATLRPCNMGPDAAEVHEDLPSLAVHCLPLAVADRYDFFQARLASLHPRTVRMIQRPTRMYMQHLTPCLWSATVTVWKFWTPCNKSCTRHGLGEIR